MERGQQLAEHTEDCDARMSVLNETLAMLEELATVEGWVDTPKYEGAVRKITREFHLASLLEAKAKYNLSEENVQKCWDALWLKYPAHPNEPMIPLGPGLVARRLKVSDAIVARLALILPGYDGLASMHGDETGEICIVTTESLAPQLDQLLAEIQAEINDH